MNRGITLLELTSLILIILLSGCISQPQEYKHFENEFFSFDYPAGIVRVESGKYFDQITESLKNIRALFFLGGQGNLAVSVEGKMWFKDQNELDSNSEWNLDALKGYGLISAILQYPAEKGYDRESHGLEEFAGKQWYQIKVKDVSNQEVISFIIEGITFCRNNEFRLMVADTSYRTDIFNQIANSFKCKGAEKE